MYAVSDSFRTPAAEDRPFYAMIGYHIRAGFASFFCAFPEKESSSVEQTHLDGAAFFL